MLQRNPNQRVRVSQKNLQFSFKQDSAGSNDHPAVIYHTPPRCVRITLDLTQNYVSQCRVSGSPPTKGRGAWGKPRRKIKQSPSPIHPQKRRESTRSQRTGRNSSPSLPLRWQKGMRAWYDFVCHNPMWVSESLLMSTF